MTGLQATAWVPGQRPPEAAVIVSLPANLATAMVLLDYAAHGLATPTPWPRQLLARVDEAARRRLRRLRSVLAHGTVWREFVLERLDEAHPAHRDWEAFRQWLAGLDEAAVQDLIATGVAAGLAYYRLEMDPIPEVEELCRRGGRDLAGWLAAVRPGGADPCRPESLAVLKNPTVLRPALEALLASWSVAGTARQEAVELALDPLGFREELAALLEAIWEAGWNAEWRAGLERLDRARQRGREVLATGPWPAGELVLRVTGLQPAGHLAGVLAGARRLAFVPCLHLDGYLSVTRSGLGWAPPGTGPDRFYLFYDPAAWEDAAGAVRPGEQGEGIRQDAGAPAPSRAPEPAQGAVGGAAAAGPAGAPAPGADGAAQVMDLGNLVPALVALGDATRFAMVQLLLRRGEMYAGEVAAALQLHPSTVSRQFTQLEAAGLVRSRREGNQKFYRADRDRLQALARLLAREFAGLQGSE